MIFSSEKIYNVFIKPDLYNSYEEAVVVREGFSIIAFLFHILWALYNRVWWVAIFAAFIIFVTQYLFNYEYISLEIMNILQLATFLWIGMEASSLVEESLEKRGYVLADMVLARSKDTALAEYIHRLGQSS